ncbi:hypothetical protein GLYMA_12G112750v4 [Glycine max]|nr:hypothetical protein GLYMA_12G112750v4 [Glycine max]KAG4385502.1 hypothetical protein GLYMA_12G112750v4 [Glycine max]KAG4385503.1 hypothetical protein GLYMA_12G112750v4 [Glycine max]KAH1142670.1 hypothetical protein GYH30_033400 [Glycine max]KAH1142671.1 hypothetical protein GYH30_033400 [Glycine max]
MQLTRLIEVSNFKIIIFEPKITRHHSFLASTKEFPCYCHSHRQVSSISVLTEQPCIMNSVFDFLRDVSPVKQTWRFKVRVLWLWEMSPLSESTKAFAIEMVLMDSEVQMNFGRVGDVETNLEVESEGDPSMEKCIGSVNQTRF